MPGVVGAGGSAAENVETFPRVAIVCRSLITVVMPDLDTVIAEQQDRAPKGIMASEVNELCLMCRAKVPPMCADQSVSSASGLGLGLAYRAGFLLLARIGDRSGG